MIRLEGSLRGHPQIAKQMMEHFLGKTVKQIRDKHNDPSYKTLVDLYNSTQGPSTIPGPLESICSSSDSEPEIRSATTKM